MAINKIEYDDWKYSVGEGWIPLVNEAINLVNKFNEEHPNNEYPINIFDVKEKWGILQIDLDFYDENLHEQIIRICLRSRYICEECGTKENVTTESNFGWVKTLCKKCRNEYIEQHKKFFKKINDSNNSNNI